MSKYGIVVNNAVYSKPFELDSETFTLETNDGGELNELVALQSTPNTQIIPVDLISGNSVYLVLPKPAETISNLINDIPLTQKYTKDTTPPPAYTYNYRYTIGDEQYYGIGLHSSLSKWFVYIVNGTNVHFKFEIDSAPSITVADFPPSTFTWKRFNTTIAANMRTFPVLRETITIQGASESDINGDYIIQQPEPGTNWDVSFKKENTNYILFFQRQTNGDNLYRWLLWDSTRYYYRQSGAKGYSSLPNVGKTWEPLISSSTDFEVYNVIQSNIKTISST